MPKFDLDLQHLWAMAHSPVRNYGIPGVTSYMVGAKAASGCVRMFACSRKHVEPITPHSHRFNFHAVVLTGAVTNRIWKRGKGDEYQDSNLVYKGSAGLYEIEDGDTYCYAFSDTRYTEGDGYSMKAAEIHSIYFERGTVLLMFEGPTLFDRSKILQPVVDHEVVPTFRVDNWMFKRDEVKQP